MRYYICYLLTIICLSCMACTEPRIQALNQLSEITEDVSEKGDDYNREEWMAFKASYQEILEEISQYDYTEDEQKEIGRLKEKVSFAVGKHAVKEIKESMSDLSNEVQGFIEGLREDFQQDNQ